MTLCLEVLSLFPLVPCPPSLNWLSQGLLLFLPGKSYRPCDHDSLEKAFGVGLDSIQSSSVIIFCVESVSILTRIHRQNTNLH